VSLGARLRIFVVSGRRRRFFPSWMKKGLGEWKKSRESTRDDVAVEEEGGQRTEREPASTNRNDVRKAQKKNQGDSRHEPHLSND